MRMGIVLTAIGLTQFAKAIKGGESLGECGASTLVIANGKVVLPYNTTDRRLAIYVVGLREPALVVTKYSISCCERG